MDSSQSLNAFGLGLASYARSGQMLDCYFPAPRVQASDAEQDWLKTQSGAAEVSAEAAAALADVTADAQLQSAARLLAEADRPLVLCNLPQDQGIDSTAAAYLKLHLLSHRLALPNSLDLSDIFAQLPNVVWTNQGPVAVEEISEALIRARLKGSPLEVTAVDKFPKMTNYVIPTGVRIADSSRVRLGAYLGDGSTVMHEGFVNFNAGAIGPGMIEGRISQGVTVGAHSDLGGSSSTQGTLSGGGEIRITVGEHCLIGANAGTGIPLGDRCTIEAGLYITAGTPVQLLDEAGNEAKMVKARELAGVTDLLFIRNARNGRVECRTNRKAIALNDALHAHN